MLVRIFYSPWCPNQTQGPWSRPAILFHLNLKFLNCILIRLCTCHRARKISVSYTLVNRKSMTHNATQREPGSIWKRPIQSPQRLLPSCCWRHNVGAVVSWSTQEKTVLIPQRGNRRQERRHRRPGQCNSYPYVRAICCHQRCKQWNYHSTDCYSRSNVRESNQAPS